MSAHIRIVWTPEEDRHLLALKLQRYQVRQIAESVGRPRSTVCQRIRALIRQMSPSEQLQYSAKRPVPTGIPTTLSTDHKSQMAGGWTPDLDAKAIELRGLGWSYARIGAVVGRNQNRVNDRLKKLAEIGIKKREEPKERVFLPKEDSSYFLKRPAGPVPDNPEPPKSPWHPGWRTCLTCLYDGYIKYFWSPSAAVRRCEKCKRMFARCESNGDGRRIDDRLELSLHI